MPFTKHSFECYVDGYETAKYDITLPDPALDYGYMTIKLKEINPDSK